MKRLFVMAGILMMAGVCHAELFEQGAVTWSTGSVQVSVSSFAVTQLVPRDSYIRANYIMNPSTFGVCLSSYPASLAISTTTSPAIIGPSTFTPDGPITAWWGPLWATMCGPGTAVPTTTKISVIRTK